MAHTKERKANHKLSMRRPSTSILVPNWSRLKGGRAWLTNQINFFVFFYYFSSLPVPIRQIVILLMLNAESQQTWPPL